MRLMLGDRVTLYCDEVESPVLRLMSALSSLQWSRRFPPMLNTEWMEIAAQIDVLGADLSGYCCQRDASMPAY